MALICHCHGVSDREIVEHVVDGAHAVDHVGDRCGAGTSCGGCIEAIEELVASFGLRDATAA